MTARIGLIIPSSNRMVEEEMVRDVPPGVTAHVARLRMTGAHRVGLDALLPRVKETAGTLIDARCDVVAFHCTANSTSEGIAGESKLLGALRDAGATHVTTTASAIRRAFDVLGARRIVLLTPYSAHVTEEEAEFLRPRLRHEKQRRILHDAAAILARPRAGSGAGRCRRLFSQLRQHFGVPGHRGDRAKARPPGGDQQSGGDL